jgi:hypothetical protein
LRNWVKNRFIFSKKHQMTSRTARSAAGGANHLFSGRPANNEPQIDSRRVDTQLPSPEEKERNIRDQYGIANGEEADPLQLEHMLGYCGDYRKTVLCMPNDENTFIRR